MKNLIGDRVREARHRRNPKITQLDLLARLAIRGIYMESTSISKIESYKRPVTDIELVAIAEALNVSILWLLKKE
ncbi:helix-turn-helix transcriptional regulator [Anaerocolumna sp. AGMB13025]|uniref:helix-turn-helix domain-containing protein n=1 Tax=Anaerocolumna sp. AGMB13025 TaxID=3039116 RepID=UPI0024204293|nr:helix-turn-helix transcriptional regulator [Anaerocolumna sp. AGMB13025]WFR57778.1 helix-turn-helix transcriptional regulator [Anaerocolumna sp. AGMB13025]